MFKAEELGRPVRGLAQGNNSSIADHSLETGADHSPESRWLRFASRRARVSQRAADDIEHANPMDATNLPMTSCGGYPESLELPWRKTRRTSDQPHRLTRRSLQN